MIFEIIINLLVFILGSAIASFLNAQIYRIENEVPLVDFFTSPSKCESCGKRLSFIELIPIFGLLFSKGVCIKCKYKVPLLYPISELVLGLSFLFIWNLQLSVIYWILIIITYFLALYDVQYKGFPKIIMNLFLGIAVIYFLSVFVLTDFTIVITGIYIAIPISLIILLMNLFKKSFGGGDILVILMLSLVLSWNQLLIILWLSVIVGGTYAVVMLLFKKLNRKDTIPFVPFIYLGLILSFFITNNLEIIFESMGILW